MPGGTLASWAALPALSWIQIVLVVALLDNSVLAQDPSKEPGDVGDGTYCQPGKVWVRYADVPGFSGKEFKLNAERNNGRAAMMGIIGMMIHEGLTGNPVWPIPVPPQPGGPRRDPSTRTRHASRASREKPPTPVRAVPQSSTSPRTTLRRARRVSARSSSPRWAWRSSASPPPSPSSAAVRTRPWASYTTPHNQTDHSWHVVLSDVSLIYTPRNLLRRGNSYGRLGGAAPRALSSKLLFRGIHSRRTCSTYRFACIQVWAAAVLRIRRMAIARRDVVRHASSMVGHRIGWDSGRDVLRWAARRAAASVPPRRYRRATDDAVQVVGRRHGGGQCQCDTCIGVGASA